MAEPESPEATSDTRRAQLGPAMSLVAASAGLFVCSALEALGRPGREPRIEVAVIGAAVWGYLAGVWLARMRRLADPMFGGQRVARVALVVVAAGMAIGATLGYARWGSILLGSAASGGLAAVLFVPSAVVVVDAAHSASRARFGSIVAGFDERTVYSTLTAVMAVAALVQLPAIALFGTGSVLSRHQARLGLVAGLASLAFVALLAWRDRRAGARFTELVGESSLGESIVVSASEVAEALPDLGLGSECVASAEEAVSYRHAAARRLLLRGNVDAARRAIAGALAARRQALAMTAACSVVFLITLLVTETVSVSG